MGNNLKTKKNKDTMGVNTPINFIIFIFHTYSLGTATAVGCCGF